jgi:TatD DNase family protein
LYINIHTHQHYSSNGISVSSYHVDDNVLDANDYHSCGIHPWFIADTVEVQLQKLDSLLHNEKCIAVGECGLDTLSGPSLEIQSNVFLQQIKLANMYVKPLIIHNVRSTDAIINCLQKSKCKVPVIFHGFNLKPQTALRLIELGYFLSFGAAILNTQSAAAASLAICPTDQLFLETDDAELPIEEVYEQACIQRKTNLADLQQQLLQNFTRIFAAQV